MGHSRDGLGIVDDRGTAIEADNGREGRLDARHTALAFERLHQRRLFADFVGASAGLRDDLELDAGAEDVLAQKAALVGIGDGALHDFEKVAIFAAQIDKAHARAHRQAGDDGAFDHGMRIVQEDQVILAGSGLAFVAVDEDVLGLGGLPGNEGPLHARREARAAASAQATGLHLVDDPLGGLREAFFHGLIAAQFEIAVDVRRAFAEAAGDDLDFIGMGDEPRHRWSCLSSSLCLRLPAIAAEDAGHEIGLELVVEVVVHLDGRRPAAGADAFDFFEGEKPVGRDALGTDAELFLEALVDIVGAAQHATDIGADLNIEFSRGLEAQHRIIGGDVAHFEFRDADALGDFGDDRVRKVAHLILRVEQHGDQSRTLHRILLDERVEALGQLGREDGQGLGGILFGTHRINSRAQASAARSISSSSDFAAQPSCLGEFHPSTTSIFSRPDDDCALALEAKPLFSW